MASRPIGTLTRKIQRQLAVTSTPPTTGPSAAARPPIAVQVRTAPPRRSGGNDREQQAERGRRHQRRARRLHDAEGDQRLDAVGERAGRRGGGEQRRRRAGSCGRGDSARRGGRRTPAARHRRSRSRSGSRTGLRAWRRRNRAPILGRPTLTMNRSRLARQMPTQTIASTWLGEARDRLRTAGRVGAGATAPMTRLGSALAIAISCNNFLPSGLFLPVIVSSRIISPTWRLSGGRASIFSNRRSLLAVAGESRRIDDGA